MKKLLLTAVIACFGYFASAQIMVVTTYVDEAAEGTIRKLFATSVGENAIHASDSDKNAIIESEELKSGSSQK